MPFTFNKAQKMVALFIMIGIFFLITVIIFIMKGNNIFEKKANYFTYLQQTYGLSSGSQIKYKGTIIGKITHVSLTKDDRIYVKFQVFKSYLYLMTVDSVLKISSGLLGGGGLVLEPNKDTQPLPENSLVYSSDMDEGIAILTADIKPAQKTTDLTAQAQQVLDMILEMKPVLMKTLVNVQDITRDAKIIVASLKGEGSTPISEQVMMILDQVSVTVASANKLIDTIYSPDNSIGAILSDKKSLFNTLDKSIANINALVSKLQNLPEDLKKILAMTEENLIQLKYVLENIPLIPKSSGSYDTTMGFSR